MHNNIILCQYYNVTVVLLLTQQLVARPVKPLTSLHEVACKGVHGHFQLGGARQGHSELLYYTTARATLNYCTLQGGRTATLNYTTRSRCVRICTGVYTRARTLFLALSFCV